MDFNYYAFVEGVAGLASVLGVAGVVVSSDITFLSLQYRYPKVGSI